MQHKSDSRQHISKTQDAARRNGETPNRPRARSCRVYTSQGTPPSNTVPSKYNSDNFVLRFGIDSLYLSYQGELSEQWEQKLTGLKDLAQHEDPKQQAKAQLSIGDHLFEVKDKGQKPFAYVLADNWFRICISSISAKAMPLAYIQISSEVLTLHHLDEIIQDLEFILNTLAANRSEAKVSRVDLFADFTTHDDLDNLDIKQWVTRTTLFDKHYIRPAFTGWSIGYKGDISARLYDKTIEIKKSLKDYLLPIWEKAGWNGEQSIWRLEFQFKREALQELQSSALVDLLTNQGGLWRYASKKWLKLCIPNPKDSKISRWPMHPLWLFLSQINWEDNSTERLLRVRKHRPPCDQSLFVNGMGGLTSFMALHDIHDPYDGFRRYMKAAKQFHDVRSRFSETTFHKYIQQKVKEKGRRFNTMINTPPKDSAQTRLDAKKYRTTKDGE